MWRANVVKILKDLLFNIDVLDDGFDYQIAIREVYVVSAGGDIFHEIAFILFGYFAFTHIPVPVLCYAFYGSVQKSLVQISHYDLQPGLSRYLCNSCTHGSCP